MATKKPTKTKKVTEIDDAKVKIEVDEIEDKDEAEEKVEEVETPEDEKEEVEEATVEESDEIIEDFEEEGGRFSWKKVILFTLVAAVVGAIIVGGYLFFKEGYTIKIEKADKTQEEKAIDIPEVTPTPTPAGIDRESYDIEVLNGSGIEGEAAAVQELLEDEGFSVSDIGNADNAAYLDTEVYYLEDVDEDYLDELIGVLEERGPTDMDEAPDDQTEDVVVIVGSELTDPDATPTPDLE